MTTGASNLIEISATIVAETKNAWLLDHGTDTPEWIPKSQAEQVDHITFEMPEWLAHEKGMI